MAAKKSKASGLKPAATTARVRLGPPPDINAPGLVWQPRRASWSPIWKTTVDWPHKKNVNLSRFADRPDLLVAECVALNEKVAAWQAGVREHVVRFTGKLSYYLTRYRDDEDSPFHKLRPGSRHPYEFYLARLISEIGDRRIDKITGVDLQRWHDRWSVNGEKLAASKMMRAVLDAAISYGVMSHAPGTPELRAAMDLQGVLKAASRKIPNPRRRESTVTADDVVRLRQAAHADGRPSMALAYALVFETTMRLWDVIGQWWPADTPLISDVVAAPYRSRKEAVKWFGIRWEDIDENLVLRYVPSKTSAKTGLAVTFPLARAPMVMEELEHWPADKRIGPVIVNESTGQPYSGNYFGEFWRKDRKAAGLPSSVWARDLRASGITEGRAAGVSTDDAAKVAGHASTKTTSAIYDRAALEASERFADARSAKRRTAQN